MILPVILLVAGHAARAAAFPWEECGDQLGPAWFVVARPDDGRGRAYGTFRCQSLAFGELPCRAAVAVGRMDVVTTRSNGTLFYQLRAMKSGTTQGILAFFTGHGGGTAYCPLPNPRGAAFPLQPGALLSTWLSDERTAGRLASGLEVHTWACPGGDSIGRPDLSPLGLVHVPHEPVP
ncbi:MAG: hypothetical protein Q8P18_30605 [Pseudomonadota bacterium]|nr:hypothetical protein [Pseudomonadota bacterium]